MADSTYPFTWTENSKEDQDMRAKFYASHKTNFVQQVISHPMGVNMPKEFVEKNIHTRIWKMQPRSDDVWVVTYPKSGTTMVQELLWQMSRGCDVNSEESKKKLLARSPFLEMGALFKECWCDDSTKLLKLPAHVKDPIAYTESLEGPRIIKTHLPVCMLPPNLLENSKVVVIARNAKDVCVSFYHHEKVLDGWNNESASFEDFVKFFMEGRPGAYGNYWAHLKVGLQHL